MQKLISFINLSVTTRLLWLIPIFVYRSVRRPGICGVWSTRAKSRLGVRVQLRVSGSAAGLCYRLESYTRICHRYVLADAAIFSIKMFLTPPNPMLPRKRFDPPKCNFSSKTV